MSILARPPKGPDRPRARQPQRTIQGVIVVKHSPPQGRWDRNHYTAQLKGLEHDYFASALHEPEAIRLLLDRLREAGRSGWLPDYRVQKRD